MTGRVHLALFEKDPPLGFGKPLTSATWAKLIAIIAVAPTMRARTEVDPARYDELASRRARLMPMIADLQDDDPPSRASLKMLSTRGRSCRRAGSARS